MLVPYTYSLIPAHLIALAHIGQLSAFVYNVRSFHAAEASDTESLYAPLGSVRMLVQLPMATISPCRVGFPVTEFWFTPVQISSPRPLLAVWLTMAVPKAAKGQEEPEALRASLAARIQYVRVEWRMPLTISSGVESWCCDALPESWDSCATAVVVNPRTTANRTRLMAIFASTLIFPVALCCVVILISVNVVVARSSIPRASKCLSLGGSQ